LTRVSGDCNASRDKHPAAYGVGCLILASHTPQSGMLPPPGLFRWVWKNGVLFKVFFAKISKNLKSPI